MKCNLQNFLPSNGHFLIIIISLSHQNKINKKLREKNYQAIATTYNNACLCNFVLFDIDNQSTANGFKQKKK